VCYYNNTSACLFLRSTILSSYMAKFAIIQTGGKQYKVREGNSLKVEKLDIEVGKPVVFDKVLLAYDEEKGLELGKPFLEDAKVKGEVMEQGKGEKIIVFKYKPKKRYRKKTGHRQRYTLVKITRIGAEEKGAKEAKEVKPKTERKTEEKQTRKRKATSKQKPKVRE